MKQSATRDGRKFSKQANAVVKRELKNLTLQLSHEKYQASLERLGKELGVQASEHLGKNETFAVVTTPEDADFLTRGMLDALPKKNAHLVCYWTTRFENSATVHKEYVDPTTPTQLDTVVIAKSIISSGCIVRTNLEALLKERKPKRILIVAPVMLEGAEAQLRAAFSKTISKRFEFITFATDSRKDGHVVTPGVGGMVEERLGLHGKIAPALVREWRSRVSSEL